MNESPIRATRFIRGSEGDSEATVRFGCDQDSMPGWPELFQHHEI